LRQPATPGRGVATSDRRAPSSWPIGSPRRLDEHSPTTGRPPAVATRTAKPRSRRASADDRTGAHERGEHQHEQRGPHPVSACDSRPSRVSRPSPLIDPLGEATLDERRRGQANRGSREADEHGDRWRAARPPGVSAAATHATTPDRLPPARRASPPGADHRRARWAIATASECTSATAPPYKRTEPALPIVREWPRPQYIADQAAPACNGRLGPTPATVQAMGLSQSWSWCSAGSFAWGRSQQVAARPSVAKTTLGQIAETPPRAARCVDGLGQEPRGRGDVFASRAAAPGRTPRRGPRSTSEVPRAYPLSIHVRRHGLER